MIDQLILILFSFTLLLKGPYYFLHITVYCIKCSIRYHKINNYTIESRKDYVTVI